MSEQGWDYAGALEQLAKQLPEGISVDVGTGGATAVSRPDSTNIDKIGYIHEKRIMTVTFRNGGIYAYTPISWPTFHAIATAPSAGKAFHQHIRRPGPEAEFTTTRLDTPVLKRPKGVTEEDLPDVPLFDPSLQELEESLEKAWPAEIITDDDEEDAACPHVNLPAGQAPMVRCRDCGRVVARP